MFIDFRLYPKHYPIKIKTVTLIDF